MAATVSPATGRHYGVARVCQVWDVPRSSFYAARQAAAAAGPAKLPARRGPKPAVSDDALLAAIKDDLARSPWTGEGHRKVWARLRVIDGIRVARKRVLRLMREHALLSPHRARQRGEAAHDRRIVTEAPNIMWAIDATQITTVQDGKVWLFGVAEHWNAELLGWHVSKRGTRFEAIQALGMAVRQQFGCLSAGAARGVALRHDHGSNFMADDFQRQARFWGLAPSYAFVGEPETTDDVEQPFSAFDAIFPERMGDRVAKSGARRGRPRRAAYGRSSFAAPMRTRFGPFGRQPSVRRRYAASPPAARRLSASRVAGRL
jgi:putative transposase